MGKLKWVVGGGHVGGYHFCVSRCKTNQNETELLIRKVVDIQRRGGKLAGRAAELEQQLSDI